MISRVREGLVHSTVFMYCINFYNPKKIETLAMEIMMKVQKLDNYN